jgi:uncharacterized protein
VSEPVVLPTERLRALLAEFRRCHGAKYRLRALGFFGSYARGVARPDSDVDIVFDTDAPNLFLTAMLRQDLEAWLGRPVDVLQTRGLANSRLKARVEREAVYV